MAGMMLYDYQLDAIDRLHTGSILCGGVGSGKSLTALGYYYLQNGGSREFLTGGKYKTMDNPKTLYIITTARKRDTLEWEGELNHFLMSTDPEFNKHGPRVIVDSWNNIGKYKYSSHSFFIFDEQRVVGNGSWVKSFLKISKNNDWILLSATPGDTWSDYIPVFLANGFYKNKTEFTRDHIIYSRFTKYPKVDRYINTGRLIRLRNKILVNMDFNRSTTQHYQDIICSYDMVRYKTLVRDRWNIWENKPVVNAAELCYCLRKVVNSDEDRILKLHDLCRTHTKMIVFYNYDYELELIKSEVFHTADGKEFAIAEWNGHKHQDIPTTDAWLYLVQYNAGAEGWNCIKTDTMVFFSQTYSYKQFAQAAGRIDRLNTPYTDLYYYTLRSMAKIDLAIKLALKNKKKFNEAGFVKKL